MDGKSLNRGGSLKTVVRNSDQMKKSEIGGPCSMHGEMRNFGRKTWR
jgi:hypothetical protein